MVDVELGGGGEQHLNLGHDGAGDEQHLQLGHGAVEDANQQSQLGHGMVVGLFVVEGLLE